jgi:glycosyltransferase involved in cell wall biosynthesis
MVNLSIIIPTAGRTLSIKYAINSLLRIKPESYNAEIIVIDNNFNNDLSKDLYEYCKKIQNRVRYFRETSPGLTAARHRGALESKGEILTFIDDDIEVSELWLKNIINIFNLSDIALVGGPSIPKFTCSIPIWFWDYLKPTQYGGWMCGWLSLLDIGHDVIDINPNYIWGLNFSIKKTVLYSCGGFHIDLVPKEMQNMQGDGETGLTMKIKAAGYKALYSKDVLIFHHCGSDRLNIEYFKKRAYFQGVCDSYTQIRNYDKDSKNTTRNIRSLLYGEIKKYGSFLKKSNNIKKNGSIEGVRAMNETDKAYREGWLFHQNEVNINSSLYNWIKRDNYLNVDLRDKGLIENI